MEAWTPTGDRLCVQGLCDFCGDPSSVEAVPEQILKMELGILNLVRLGRIDAPQFPPTKIVSETGGIGKVPGFQMPLCICVLDTWPELTPKKVRQLLLE